MMVHIITLFGTLNFIYYLNLMYIKKQIVPTSHLIVLTSHMMVLKSHLMVSIEWVLYLQKECGYCKMTHISIEEMFVWIYLSFVLLTLIDHEGDRIVDC